MKNSIFFILCMVFVSSCQQSKWGRVKDFIVATNNYDKSEIGSLLTDGFMYYGKDTLGKSDFLSRIDSLKSVECLSTIVKSQEIDSIVRTEEQICSIIDSLLEVKPKIIQMKSYRFSEDKLASITIDSTLYYDEYMNSLNEKMGALFFYIKDRYDVEDEKEIINNIKKYLNEYTSLPTLDKKIYKIYANLQGTFVSKNCPYYRKLIFRGKKTATIVDAFWGMHFTSSFEIDENYIRVKTDKSDLLFEMKDNKTLIGEGFAKGTFTKINK